MSLELKVFYVESFLALAIDTVDGDYRIPITSYYLWPRTNAWEQIKLELDSKTWIKNSEKIKILNYIVEIMNYWRINKLDESATNIRTKFPQLNFVNLIE